MFKNEDAFFRSRLNATQITRALFKSKLKSHGSENSTSHPANPYDYKLRANCLHIVCASAAYRQELIRESPVSIAHLQTQYCTLPQPPVRKWDRVAVLISGSRVCKHSPRGSQTVHKLG